MIGKDFRERTNDDNRFFGFLAENGVKIQIFENLKKVPLDNLEIHVLSKFEVC